MFNTCSSDFNDAQRPEMISQAAPHCSGFPCFPGGDTIDFSILFNPPGFPAAMDGLLEPEQMPQEGSRSPRFPVTKSLLLKIVPGSALLLRQPFST